VKMHCSVLAEQALQAAIEDFREKHGGPQAAADKTPHKSRRRKR
jgi:hypothetical protein